MSNNLAKLHVGHLAAHAVLANILIDKGIISREELCERLQQGLEAASRSSAGPQGAKVLDALLDHLQPKKARRSKH